jgi:hypothetical protein
MLVSTRMAQRTGVWAQYRKAPLTGTFTAGNALKAGRHPLKAANWLRRYVRPRKAPWQSLRGPITLSESECRDFFARARWRVPHYGGLFRDHPQMTLYYEDLVHDRNDVFNRVQSFLAVQPRPLTVTTRKQNPEPLRELVENYDELYEVFKHGPEAAFFD